MTVLVVDDQTNVVSGIISGVHWSDIGVSKVLPALQCLRSKAGSLHRENRHYALRH